MKGTKGSLLATQESLLKMKTIWSFSLLGRGPISPTVPERRKHLSTSLGLKPQMTTVGQQSNHTYRYTNIYWTFLYKCRKQGQHYFGSNSEDSTDHSTIFIEH